MPKAAKPRSTKARHSPLSTSDANAPKKQEPADASEEARSSATSGKGKEEKVSKKKVKKEEVEEKPIPPSESYLLLVRLTNSEDPIITRLLSVPSSYTFAQLHHVLQIAFGWAGCHMHSFDVSKILEPEEQGNFMTGRGEILLSLHPDDEDPAIYPDPESIKKEGQCTLADIYASEEYGGKVEVSYSYDHGDGWDHEIAFLGRADPSMRKAMHIPDDMQAICLNGEGHPCAEDCGGSGGWEDLKALFTKRKRDLDGKKAWYKEECANGDPKGLDPYKWDILEVNNALDEIKG